MNCGCQSYQCLNVSAAPCAESVMLPLNATETGMWKAVIEFGGIERQYQFTVVNGAPIQLPNRFNESYNHTLRIYTSSGALLNATCYTVKTRIMYAPQIAGNGDGSASSGVLHFVGRIEFVAVTGQSEYVSPALIGAQEVQVIVEMGELQGAAYTFNPTTGRIGFANTLQTDQYVTIRYWK